MDRPCQTRGIGQPVAASLEEDPPFQGDGSWNLCLSCPNGGLTARSLTLSLDMLLFPQSLSHQMSPLQDELRKKHPFDLPEQEAFLNVLRTASVLATPFERLLRSRDLSSSGYNILRILRGAQGQPRCPAEIARDLVADVPDMTRLLDRLADAGLISRAREDASDRRKVAVRLTDAGRQLLAELDQPLLDLHRAQLGSMSREQLRELSRLLVEARTVAAQASALSEGARAGAPVHIAGAAARGQQSSVVTPQALPRQANRRQRRASPSPTVPEAPGPSPTI